MHAVRRDIADIALAEWIFAPHYARADHQTLASLSAMLLTRPSHSAEASSQLLHGEGFAVLDISGGWAWGYCAHDHYVGYLPTEALKPRQDTSHVVSAREAPIFDAPSIKAPVVGTLTLGARLAGAIDNDFVGSETGFVHRRHVAPLPADPVAIAKRLIDSPYLWGGRGAGGIDCSGLIQLAHELAGIRCPRDSDQQREGLGRLLDDSAPLMRGDLVFFPGHVGLMVDEGRMIHANAFWMAVTIEPLADVMARSDHPVLARRRLA